MYLQPGVRRCACTGTKTTSAGLRVEMLNRISTSLYQRPRLILFLLLGPPVIYMGVVYLGSLLALLINSFYSIDDFTGLIIRKFTLRTLLQVFSPANREIILRTTVMATSVTLASALISFPLAYYIAHADS